LMKGERTSLKQKSAGRWLLNKSLVSVNMIFPSLVGWIHFK